MLYTLKSQGKKYAYDTISGAVIPVNALQFKMLGAVIPPLSAVCPTSLRYELAKFDSIDVDEAYDFLYSLSKDSVIFVDGNNISIRCKGEYSCDSENLAADILSIAFEDAPTEIHFSAVGDDGKILKIAETTAARLKKYIIQ